MIGEKKNVLHPRFEFNILRELKTRNFVKVSKMDVVYQRILRV